jgi:hypothetical protein
MPPGAICGIPASYVSLSVACSVKPHFCCLRRIGTGSPLAVSPPTECQTWRQPALDMFVAPRGQGANRDRCGNLILERIAGRSSLRCGGYCPR